MPTDDELLAAAEEWAQYLKVPPTPGNQGESAAATATALASIANSLLVIARDRRAAQRARTTPAGELKAEP